MTQFDFNQVGKRMPYTVPDGFFDQLEADVIRETSPSPSQGGDVNTAALQPHVSEHPLLGRGLGRLLLAIAAAVALFLVVQPLLPKDDADDFESVQLAYNNLSQEDQEFLAEIYEEDEFMDNLTNTEEYEENI